MENDPHLILEKPLVELEFSDMISVSPDCALLDVLHQLQKSKIGAIGVIENDIIIGILSERDFLFRIIGKINDWHQLKIRDCMTKSPIFLNSNSVFKEAITLMIRRDFRHIPIQINESNKWKIISAKDVLRILVNQFPESLKSYGTKLDWSIMELDSFGENFTFNDDENGNKLSENLFLLPLRKAIFRNPLLIDEKDDIKQVLIKMQESKQAAAIVTKFKTQVTGIITERDFLFNVIENLVPGEYQPVKRYMTENPHTLLSRHFLCFAINNMFKFNYRNTVIVDEDKVPIACVTIMDILRVFTWNLILDK